MCVIDFFFFFFCAVIQYLKLYSIGAQTVKASSYPMTVPLKFAEHTSYACFLYER